MYYAHGLVGLQSGEYRSQRARRHSRKLHGPGSISKSRSQGGSNRSEALSSTSDSSGTERSSVLGAIGSTLGQLETALTMAIQSRSQSRTHAAPSATLPSKRSVASLKPIKKGNCRCGGKGAVCLERRKSINMVAQSGPNSRFSENRSAMNDA